MNNYAEDVQTHALNFGDGIKQKWEDERQPYAALIELTPHCNMNCVHCYLQNNHASKEMTYDQIIGIIDLLCEKGILFLTMTGGEIFIRQDFLKIYLYAKKRGFLIELFTNGTLLTQKAIDTFIEYPPLLVELSLYGACEDTYRNVTGIACAFDKVIDNCKRLKEANIRVSLKSPIIDLTLNEIEEMKALAQSMEIPFNYSFEICPTIDGKTEPQNHQVSQRYALKHEFQDYFKIHKGKTETKANRKTEKSDKVFDCKIGKSSFVIDYTGRMCPCIKMREYGVPITSETFDSTWKHFGDFLDMRASSQYKCQKCSFAYYCEICPAEMKMLYGAFEFRPDGCQKYARARKAFYETEETLDEAIALLGE